VLKTLAIVVVLVVAAVLIYAATQPDTFGVQRSATVKAPPEKIFALVNDLQQWRGWSPYENKDPAMQRHFTGPAAGKGAAYAWEGNKEVGQGRMEISGTTPPRLVTIQLDFVKPFEAHNRVDFRIEPQGETTRVTWAMTGPAPYITKLMSTFVDMDKMIGKDFEVGLANLKAVAEQ
jgi:carbon monoxide dehydrogenase subunit G